MGRRAALVDVTITDVALPDIRAVLHLDVTGQQRVINAYPPTGTTSRMPKTAASPMAMGLRGESAARWQPP